MNKPILIQYPSRGRPQRFMDGIRSMYDNAVDPELFVVNAVLDQDDNTLPEYINRMAEYAYESNCADICISAGKSSSKIDAFNRVPDGDWKIIVAFSDDMRFSVKGWDRLIMDYMPEDLDWFLHFYEKDSAERCSVMNITGHAYYNRFGYIYHPSYKSLWCDVEETEKAKLLDRYLFIPTMLFVHMNPAYGHLERDDMFDRQQADWHEDEVTYNFRKAKNFDLIHNNE